MPFESVPIASIGETTNAAIRKYEKNGDAAISTAQTPESPGA